MKRFFGNIVLVCAGITAQSAVLWDNNVITNGVNGRAISPPSFPNIRVVDDIRVGEPGWIVDMLKMSILEDGGWSHGGTMEIYLYDDDGGAPGTLNATWGGLSFRRVVTQSGYQRPRYRYEIDVGGRTLDPGAYWIGARNPNASGAGTNYWLTSDGGPDGRGSNTGYFSLNAGRTWAPEGFGWQHAFVIEGRLVAEPATILAVGAGLAALTARRSRRNFGRRRRGKP